MKIFRIIRAWAKRFGVVKVTLAERKLSEMRLQVCNICEFSVESAFLNVLNSGEAEETKGLKCKVCGCPCLEKSLEAAETCPKQKW